MEFMSNIGNTADVYRPSLFELIAQDKLNDLFRPALRYILTIYAHRYPRYLLKILNYYDELYGALVALIERHYLYEWNGSFSESFYGLRRVSHSVTHSSSKIHTNLPRDDSLKPIDVRNSLLMLVGVPYIKLKLDNMYDSLSGGEAARLLGDDLFEEEEEEEEADEEDHRHPSLYCRLKEKARPIVKIMSKSSKKGFVGAYPYFHLLYHLIPLGYHIGYLFDRTEFYNPSGHLSRLATRRMTPDDYRKQQTRQELQRAAVVKMASEMRRGGKLAYFSWLILRYGMNGLKVVLPMAVFILKFLEWWYGGGSGPRPKSSGVYLGPLPDPPANIEPDPAGIPLPADSKLCPLCCRSRTNPAMLPTGYTFCYPCLFSYVQDNNRCPVTFQDVSLVDIRKLFSDEDIVEFAS